MLRRIDLKKILAIATLASLFSLSSLCLPELVWAQRNQRNSNQGLPSRRVGGATRGDNAAERSRQCSSLVALSPKYLVTTTEASPTLFFCIPPIENSQNVKVDFHLYNANNRSVYQTTFVTATQPGIASLKLPASNEFTELAVNRNYRWTLSLSWDGGDRIIEGWMRRVQMTPALADQLTQADALERVKLYRESQLWYEALEELAQLKRSHPDDSKVSQQWTQLLAAMNLSAIAKVPLLDTNLAPQTSQSVLIEP